MITRFDDVSVEKFREAGMLCLVNTMLSVFGFVITAVNKGNGDQLEIGRVNPFNSEPEYVKKGLEKAAKYLNENLPEIYNEEDKNAYLRFDLNNPINDSNSAIAQKRVDKLIEYLQNTPIDKMPTSITLPNLTGEWKRD